MLPGGHRFQLSFDIALGDGPTVVQLPIIESVTRTKRAIFVYVVSTDQANQILMAIIETTVRIW